MVGGGKQMPASKGGRWSEQIFMYFGDPACLSYGEGLAVSVKGDQILIITS